MHLVLTDVFYDEVHHDIPEDVLGQAVHLFAIVHGALHAVAHGDGLAEDGGGDGGEPGDVGHVGAVQAEHLGATVLSIPQAWTVYYDSSELYYDSSELYYDSSELYYDYCELFYD